MNGTRGRRLVAVVLETTLSVNAYSVDPSCGGWFHWGADISATLEWGEEDSCDPAL